MKKEIDAIKFLDWARNNGAILKFYFDDEYISLVVIKKIDGSNFEQRIIRIKQDKNETDNQFFYRVVENTKS